MKVLISGSRSITNYQTLLDAIQESGFEIDFLIHGGHWQGVDVLADKYALEQKLHPFNVLRCSAYWKQFGKSAGIHRNQAMIKVSDAVIAVWDGKSKGTEYVIKYCESTNKPLYVKYCEDFVFSEAKL